ncbi:hypothetical protein IV417_01685 [Alphaproteobacteria bacterium KMM 3653]|uniref:PNPLA domain-containing protein n=1 Tax=Harenicola maris TaxID=2841044 RepID=A0AAP2CM43_9RHOB|nr:hypothetical protein [Harenicola maris]
MFSPAIHTPNPGPTGAGFNRMTIVNVLEHIYGPVIVGLGFGYCFAFVDPAQEVILGFLAEIQGGSGAWSGDGAINTSRLRWVRLLTTMFLLAALPVVLAEAARRIVRFYGMGGWIPWFAMGLAGLVPAGLIVTGLRRAIRSPEAVDITASTAFILGAGLVLFLLYGAGLLLMRGSPDQEDRRDSYRSTSLFFAVLLTAVVLVGFLYPEWGEFFGPISLAAAFAIGLGTVLAALTCASRAMPGGLPLTLLIALTMLSQNSLFMIGVLFVFGLGCLWRLRRKTGRQLPGNAPPKGPRRWLAWLRAFGPRFVPLAFAGFAVVLYAQQHRAADCGSLSGCHLITGVDPAPNPIPSVRIAFERWPYREVPTIRIVAAQGGGLYAAYQTAFYLAARADADPEFAKSVFAISGVSGGSVGAGVYWAVRASGLCDTAIRVPNCHKDAVRYILRRDYLSPSLAAFFFRDNLDNFVPYSAYRLAPMDRGRVLEERFVTAVDQWEGFALRAPGSGLPSRLETALSKSWMPERGAPLLFMNGTEVGDGTRHALSPVDMLDRQGSRIALQGARDMTVANAMVISARFPLVTPPARVRAIGPGGKETELLQLVDGGYFDNSGIETAIDIVRALMPTHGAANIELIAITVDEPPLTSGVKGTIGAPVSAFTNAWRARIGLTARRALQLIEPSSIATEGDLGAKGKVSICAARSIPYLANFTVSWYLAGVTFKDIEDQILNGTLAGKTAQAAPFEVRLGSAPGKPADCPTGTQEAEIGRLKVLQRSGASSVIENFQFGPPKPQY